MDPADAAGREDLDPGAGGEDHGRGHGCRPITAAGQRKRQVPAGELGHVQPALAQIANLLSRQPDAGPAAEHGDGGGHRAFVPHRCLDRKRGLDVAGKGHAVGNDGGLERDHRLAVGEGGSDILGQGQHGVGHGFRSSSDCTAA